MKDILLGDFCILWVTPHVWVAIYLGINKERKKEGVGQGKGERKMPVRGGGGGGEAKLSGAYQSAVNLSSFLVLPCASVDWKRH